MNTLFLRYKMAVIENSFNYKTISSDYILNENENEILTKR